MQGRHSNVHGLQYLDRGHELLTIGDSQNDSVAVKAWKSDEANCFELAWSAGDPR